MLKAYVWWNKIENNAIKMHLYERYKIDLLGTSQGRHPTNVFSERFEDVRSTFIKNLKNKQ